MWFFCNSFISLSDYLDMSSSRRNFLIAFLSKGPAAIKNTVANPDKPPNLNRISLFSQLTSCLVDVYFQESGIFELCWELFEEWSYSPTWRTPIRIKVQYNQTIHVCSAYMLVQFTHRCYLHHHLQYFYSKIAEKSMRKGGKEWKMMRKWLCLLGLVSRVLPRFASARN